MPLYLAPAAVQAEGQPVALPTDGSQPSLATGQRLVAVMNTEDWQTAMDVSFAATFQKLRKDATDGIWRDVRLYSVNEDRITALADGRRATLDGRPVAAPPRIRIR
jgi:hypothetical protein